MHFKLLTSCWCCSLVRLSSLAWLSFNFCISVFSLSIWSFKSSTSLCSWAISFSNRFTLLPPRREFTPLSTFFPRNAFIYGTNCVNLPKSFCYVSIILYFIFQPLLSSSKCRRFWNRIFEKTNKILATLLGLL